MPPRKSPPGPPTPGAAAPSHKKGLPKETATSLQPARKPPVSKKAPLSLPEALPGTLKEQKIALRRTVRADLAKLRERARRSREICAALTSHPSWRRSVIVAIFAPMQSEPDVELLWPEAMGKTLCYPAIRQGGLDFISVGGPESVSPGQFGIREPAFEQARIIPPDTFDLILVPGAAFTANGERLGRGGGFYDRLLSSPGFRAFKVGVCFQRQVVDAIPTEIHDQRVHRVVTERGWLPRPDFLPAGKSGPPSA